jgi:hypothetical protein
VCRWFWSSRPPQPGAESLELRAEPINRDVRLIQLLGGLLAGREQEDQRCSEFAVGGDVDSFLAAVASVESRLEAW